MLQLDILIVWLCSIYTPIVEQFFSAQATLANLYTFSESSGTGGHFTSSVCTSAPEISLSSVNISNKPSRVFRCGNSYLEL